MNTSVKLFDANNKLVPNFDEEIEKILISIHGENYYDTDEELVNTNEIPVQEEAIVEVKEEVTQEVSNKSNKKISFKDFIPVLFFILIFIVIVIAGYYFLNTVDLMSFIGH